MRLTAIQVHRMAGIDAPFEVALPADSGLVLIHGPNGSGKSSLCRAVRAALWPVAESAGAKGRGREWLDRCDVVTTWLDRGVPLEAEILHGSVRWRADGADAAAPALPPSELSRCWSIEIADLLRTSDDTADEFARRIRVAMAGGFDLACIQTPESARTVREHARALRNALATHHACKAKQDALTGDEQELARMESKIREARRAQIDQKAVADAIELGARRADLTAVSGVLDSLPRQLADMSGDEIEQLDALLADRDKADRKRVDGERALAQAGQDLSAAGFGDLPPDATAIAECRERLVACEKLYGRAREVDRNKLAARTRLADASGSLVETVGDDVLEVVTDIDLAGVDEWLGRRGEIAAQLSAQRQFVARLSRERQREPTSNADHATLARRAERLSAWLKQEVAPASDRLAAARWATMVVAIGGVASALAWPRSDVSAWILALALLALALLALLLRRRRAAGPDDRVPIERDLASIGLVGDPPWSGSRAVVELERTVMDLASTERRAVFREEEERSSALITDFSQQLTELDKRRSGLTSRLRIDNETGDVRLRDVVVRVAAWRRARSDLDSATADATAAELQLSAELARLGALLKPLGESQPTDVPQAKAIVQVLGDRELDDARARIARESANAKIAECQADASEIDKKARRVLQRAGVDGLPGDETRALLRERVKLLDAFREQSDQAKGLRLQIDEARRRLEQATRVDLEQASSEALERARLDAEERAGSLEELVGRQKELELRLGAARTGSELEEARAHEREARSVLEELYEEAMDAAVRQFLLDRLRHQHEQQAQPVMLERAKTLFAAFTRGEWELVVAGEGQEATFRARPNGKPARALDQLSDGTRAQLLIAARVAFAMENEGDAKLPVFLDEALAVTSPDRFRGVVGAVLELVREGRQVIYLAADPQDVAHWRSLCAEFGETPPHVIDLAELREIAGAATPASLAVAPRSSVPPADGLDAAAYGAILRVPAFESFQSVERAHLFYALRDDLPLLHRLLDTIGVATIGAWERVAGLASVHGDRGLLSPDEQARLAARIACVKTWHEAFRVGRGDRVDREALEHSQAVSPSYLDKLVELARELDGDGRRLLEVLANPSGDPRTRGFRTEKRDQLEAFLLERHYLDRRDRLSPAEVRARVLAAAQPWIGMGGIGEAQVLELVNALEHAAGEAADSDTGST